MAGTPRAVRVAAVGDLHCKRTSGGRLRRLVAQASERADVLLLCGDLTEYGEAEEARILASELAPAGVPMIGVLGNHDFESGQQGEVRRILSDAGVQMLDGESCEIHGVGFAGAKGFCGGFGERALGPWGEAAIKRLVQEAVNEAFKLESALARLHTPARVVLLHYAPIEATVQGEPLVIYPFLGSSRLEEPLARHPVHVVFHGHAHKGALEGRTTGGVPVYNVCLGLLEERRPGEPAFRVVDVPGVAEGPEDA
jgi:Icc-related predicted phosphoesterase